MLLIIRCQEGGFRQRLRFHCEQEQVELFGKKIRLLCLNRASRLPARKLAALCQNMPLCSPPRLEKNSGNYLRAPECACTPRPPFLPCRCGCV